jgi:Tol biopolymer transport system component/tRNA A-37 threonylcarbamoyl transferase component Bud32
MLVQSDLQNGQQEPVERTEVAPLNLSPGSRWKNFIIEKRIGTGGFGIVYRALDTVLNRVVALKFLTTRDALQEGKLLAKVKDPGVVAVHSIEEESGATAICMEFVRGVDLENYLNQHGRRLHAMHAALIGRCLCRSLAAVHRVGLLHRDVKPRNVIASDDDRFVLVDFGLGVQIGSSTSDSAGTLHYMAPELLEKKQSTRSSDIYAVGVLLFYLVCGEYPVAGASAEDVLDAHRTGRRRHLADYVQVPPAFESLIDRAIARDPEQRFRSAGAMLAALDEVLQDHPVGRRRKWAIYGAIGVVAAASVIFSWREHVRRSDDLATWRLDSASGVYDDISMSDDGSVVVFASDKANHGDMDVWVEDTLTGASKPLTGAGADEHEPAVSANGRLVAYRSERPDSMGVYVKSPYGTDERLVAPDGRHPRFSPDGSRLAYWIGEEGNLRTAGAKTFVVPVSGGAPIQILPDFADCRFPAWSPDGRYLLVTATREKSVAPQDAMDWWLVPVDRPTIATKLNFYPKVRGMQLRMQEYPPHWAGSQIVFAAHNNEVGSIWQVRVLSVPLFDHLLIGEPSALTKDVPYASSPWNLADGTVAWTAVEPNINIWALRLDSPQSDPVQLTRGVHFQLAPHVSVDGRYLLWTRLASNTYSTWWWDTQTARDPEELKTFPPRCSVILSPDAKRIVYAANGKAQAPLFEYLVNPKTTRMICRDCGTPLDFWRGASQVLYTDGRALKLVNTETGQSLPIVEQAGRSIIDAAVSPAGNRMAFVSRVDEDRAQVIVAAMHGDEVESTSNWVHITSGAKWSDKPRWSADGLTLYYYDTLDGFGCLYAQAFDKDGRPSGKPTALRHLHSVGFSTLQLSESGFNLAVGGGKLFFNIDKVSSNIWLEGTKPRGHSPQK